MVFLYRKLPLLSDDQVKEILTSKLSLPFCPVFEVTVLKTNSPYFVESVTQNKTRRLITILFYYSITEEISDMSLPPGNQWLGDANEVREEVIWDALSKKAVKSKSRHVSWKGYWKRSSFKDSLVEKKLMRRKRSPVHLNPCKTSRKSCCFQHKKPRITAKRRTQDSKDDRFAFKTVDMELLLWLQKKHPSNPIKNEYPEKDCFRSFRLSMHSWKSLEIWHSCYALSMIHETVIRIKDCLETSWET